MFASIKASADDAGQSSERQKICATRSPDDDGRPIRSSLGLSHETLRTGQQCHIFRVDPGIKVVVRIVRLEMNVVTESEGKDPGSETANITATT